MGKTGKANFAVCPRVLSPFFPKINLYIRPLIKKKQKQKGKEREEKDVEEENFKKEKKIF